MVLFVLGQLYFENLYLHYHHIFYLCLHVFITIAINGFTIKFCFYSFSTLFRISLYFINNMLTLILKNIVLLPSKFLTYPIICGNFMHNGLITSSSLYPIKHLKEFFEPCDSSLETNTLLTSMSSVLLTFLYKRC